MKATQKAEKQTELATEHASVFIPAQLKAALQTVRELGDFAQTADEAEMASLATLPPAFLHRCRGAAQRARERVKLCQAAREAGFATIPFGRFAGAVAGLAGLPLSPRLAELNIQDMAHPALENAASFVRLGKELGLSCRQFLLQIRLSIAELQGIVEPFATAHFRGRCGDSLEDTELACFETKLQQLEKSYDHRAFDELQELLALLRKHYADDK